MKKNMQNSALTIMLTTIALLSLPKSILCATTHSFGADLSEGLIGTTKDKPIDDPSDNVFKVWLNTLPQSEELVWLSYELQGVQDHTSVSRSINDELSVGGYLVKVSEVWSIQRELISVKWLKQGVNSIRFSLPKNAAYNYKIRNLKIEIESNTTSSDRSIEINQPTLNYYENTGYIQGFIAGKDAEQATLHIDGKQVNPVSGAFEVLVKKPDPNKKTWEVSLTAKYPDGTVITKNVKFENAGILDYQNTIADFQQLKVQKTIGSKGAELQLNSARLTVPENTLKTDQNFSITALRDVDLSALGQSMINVTKTDQGYRFLPHGEHFETPAKVSIGYDESMLPEGYTENDIRTFYFDDNKKQWIPLTRDSVDRVNKQILSLTTHFTDMINGIITVPESPETQAYNRTSMNGIKTANPSAGIFTMSPPTANNMGNASLSYPIDVPPGRLGMQPNLEIQYNSDLRNSWLGVGWDLQTSSIDIETRWGVPMYDASRETETYTLDGEQLSPISYRNTFVNRTANKQFYPRIEASFKKIIRYGDHPSNYWWEVTDKSGTRYSYGGTQASGLDTNAILTDNDRQGQKSGNIAHWALKEVRDLNNNFVLYEYSTVNDTGIEGGSVPGYQLYCQKISYTGYDTTPGNYSVTFIRDRELNEPKRKDIEINARLGFKLVSADLLRRIDVKYKNELIRGYELKYKEGAFLKTLLDSIVQFDSDNVAFNVHHFDYFDDVRDSSGTYKPLGFSEIWNSENDNIHGNFTNPLPLFNDKASALSGTKSTGFEVGTAITAGFDDLILTAKTSTAGTNYSYSQNNSEGILAMVDINGDNLPDKVFKEGNSLKFRANISIQGGAEMFGDKQSIVGITNFSKGITTINTVGIEATGPIELPVFTGSQFAFESNKTSVYFSDVNGDGLTDIVNNGTVYFNHLVNGIPNFSDSSAGTPSPITTGATIDSTMVVQDSTALQLAIEQNPLQDLVRIWIAPFDGHVNITEPVQLLQDTVSAQGDHSMADGVRVSIQYEDTVLWFARIQADDFSPKTPAGVSAIQVKKGEHLYFRVQSIFNGWYDQVHWNPVITYNGHEDNPVDPNKLPIYQYNSEKDFLLSIQMSTTMMLDGTIHIEGYFVKPATTDTVHAEIVKIDTAGKKELLWQHDFLWNSSANLPISINDSVLAGESFYFNVTANTNIDWAALSWTPLLYYTALSDTNTEVINEKGKPIYQFYPAVYYQTFNQLFQPSLPWTYNDSLETITVNPNLQLKANSKESGSIVFSVKTNLALISEESITVNNGIVGSLPAPKINVSNGEQLYFEYFTANEQLAEAITVANVSVQDSTVSAGSYAVSDTTSIFGAMYRYWGQFVYNGNPPDDNAPIIQSDLVLDGSITNPPVITVDTTMTPLQLDSLYLEQGGNKANENIFVLMMVNMQEKAWQGYDFLSFLKKEVVSSSRLGDKNPSGTSPIVVGTPQTTGARGIIKISETQTSTLAAGIAFISTSTSSGSTTYEYDFMDMNGDSYPDILSKNKIQYTLPTGGLTSSAVSNELGEVSQSAHSSIGTTLGGTYLVSSDQNSPSKSGGSKSSDAQSKSEASFGISGSYNSNKDETDFAWMDINGDGLPDRISKKKGMVALNLGYQFADEEQWIFGAISDGKATSFGAGLGINLLNNSFSAGVGLSRTNSDTKGLLYDMNGDGLLDYVVSNSKIDSKSPLTVAINTGNGFDGAVEWDGADVASASTSTGESTNAAFTVCIPVLLAKFCTNPMSNISNGVNRDDVSITDIDGDGCPDYLVSVEDKQLQVKRSTINRTNLLKSVSRPFGVNIALNYDRLGNTYDLPDSKWVLASVKMNDGFEGDGADTIYTTFTYVDGLYDRNERDFYGFKTVKVTEHDTENDDAPYRVVTQNYDNDNYYQKALLLSEVITDGAGNKYTKTENTFEVKDSTGAVIADSDLAYYYGRAFPALSHVAEYFYEGHDNPQKNTSFDYEYDLFGNVIRYVDYGDVSIYDDMISHITYHNVSDKYIIGTPKSITVKDTLGEILRKRISKMDTLTGDIIEIIQWANPANTSVYTMKYDGYGNLSHMEFPQNDNGQRMFYNYEYDDDVNSYITKVTDAYNYSSSATYNLLFGAMLTNTDLNNNSTHFKLDAIGRTDTVIGPLELKDSLPFTITFNYYPYAAVPYALTRHYDPQHPNNPLETCTFIDGLERVIQVKKDGALFSGAGQADQDSILVSGRLTFDAFGRVTQSYYPLVVDTNRKNTFNYSYDNISPTKLVYDVLDRTLVETLPDGTFSSYKYDFGKDRDSVTQFSTLITDPNGFQAESYTNVRGLKTATRNIRQNNNDIWTSYHYNAINELDTLTDDQYNKTVSTYDWLGRCNSVLHPDAGLTSFKYDKASNLIEKMTAELRSTGRAGIKYMYDYNRLSDINYPKNQKNNVHFAYGNSGASDNRAGRVVLQEDASGSQEFYYNELGALIKNIRTIVPPGRAPLLYTTQWTYDTWNRLSNMTYPDGEVLTYTYNTGGLLEKMEGKKDGVDYNYITQLGYDKFEQRVYLKYGNGTETTYEYEPERRRLHHMTAETASNRMMMDNTYTYDNTMNVTALTNNAPIPDNGSLMGGSTSYSYIYDDLYRLTHAEGIYNTSEKKSYQYKLDMTYNSVNGIVSKHQIKQTPKGNSSNWSTISEYNFDYTYNPTDQPHAPTQIEDKTYTYDNNGNQTGWTIKGGQGQSRTITWDEENRIQQISDGGGKNNYVYDAGGDRVLKSLGNKGGNAITEQGAGGIGNYTIYVNPYYVLSSANISKHFFIGSSRMVTKLVSNGQGNPKIEDNQFYYHPDHLGSSNYITNTNGEVFQHQEYYPFGETFIEEKSNANDISYLFNGKELDEETGLYYYGARYYDPMTSVWQSVDPLAEKYPNMSPYTYVGNNPMNYIDPDGRGICNGKFARDDEDDENDQAWKIGEMYGGKEGKEAFFPKEEYAVTKFTTSSNDETLEVKVLDIVKKEGYTGEKSLFQRMTEKAERTARKNGLSVVTINFMDVSDDTPPHPGAKTQYNQSRTQMYENQAKKYNYEFKLEGGDGDGKRLHFNVKWTKRLE